MKRLLVCLSALLVFPGTGLGASLRLELSGSQYQGGPAFDVAFGSMVVGSGTVDPLPPDGTGVTFDFALPDLLLAGNPDLRLRLTNDARGGPGEDRNLYLIAASVDGESVPLQDFRVLLKGEPREHRLRGGHLEIWSGQEVAVASAPPGGWPLDAPVLRPSVAAIGTQAGWQTP